MSRRSALGTLGKVAGTAAVLTAGAKVRGRPGPASPLALKGRINHSVCRWCYSKLSLDELCVAAKEIGIKSIDLMKVEDFPKLQQHGLVCALVTGVPGDIGQGFNRTENHDRLAEWFTQTIPKVAEAGFPNVICFSGNRRGMDDKTGMENCAAGLKRVVGIAEKHKVTICMELLNSKVDHKDYMCDRTAWGVELCKKVGSEQFKLLYDIYHMQIMEGDVIRTINQHCQYIGHYHTGGVPGRHEIDGTQELNYTAIAKAIAETGYKGWVAQEFLPSKPDAIGSLREAIAICDV